MFFSLCFNFDFKLHATVMFSLAFSPFSTFCVVFACLLAILLRSQQVNIWVLPSNEKKRNASFCCQTHIFLLYQFKITAKKKCMFLNVITTLKFNILVHMALVSFHLRNLHNAVVLSALENYKTDDR